MDGEIQVSAPQTLRLDIGCGDKPRDGYVGIDRKLGGEAETLTFASGETVGDGTVDEIYASHVLEHMGHWQSRRALRRWIAALKPGGRIRVSVPDMGKVFLAYSEGRPVNVGGYTWGGQADDDDFHRTGFDENLLRALMEHFGAVDVKRFEPEFDDCSKLPVSLNLEGKKAARKELDRYPITPIVGVKMIQSMPRLAFTENVYAIMEAAVALGLKPTRITGVNWGQCLERAIEPHLHDGTEWILTTDYDSIFTYRHIVEMWNILHEDDRRSHIHALAPVEFKREENTILSSVVNEDGTPRHSLTLADLEPQTVPVAWAHFGLTFIRVSAIRKMNKPWFQEFPSPNNDWGPGRIDNDIGFWKNFERNGNRCYLATHVAIGHAQLITVWPDQQLSPIFQYSHDWIRGGMPPEARR